jgi:hypothetical protein
MEKQIKDALRSAIAERGLETTGIFENAAPAKRTKSVAAVGIETISASSVGMNDYLGQTQGGNTVSEVYGKRAAVRAAIDIYTPRELGADGCCESEEKVYSALSKELASALRAKELSSDETEYDKKTGMFRQRVHADLDAYFTAQTDESGLLLDFELKGVIRT